MNHSLAYKRGSWPALLLALAPEKVKATLEKLRKNYEIEDLNLAQSGLALLQLADAVLHESYFIGETPFSRVGVRVTDTHGKTGEGAAQIISDSAALARAVAVFDAVLAHELQGYETVVKLLEDGAKQQHRVDAQRQEILKRTRVDFSLLDANDSEVI